MPSSGSTAGWIQQTAPPVFQVSPSQVPLPYSPGPGCPRRPRRPHRCGRRGRRRAAGAGGAALGADVDEPVPVHGGSGEAALAAAALAGGRVAVRVALVLDHQLAAPHDGAGLLVEGVDLVVAGDGERESFAEGEAAHVGGVGADARLPLHLAGAAVDGEHVLLGGGQVEHAVLGDDGALLGGGGGAVLQVDVPGAAELADVARGDLLERGVTVVAEVAAGLGVVRGGGGVGLVGHRPRQVVGRVGLGGCAVEQGDGGGRSGRGRGEEAASVHGPSFMTSPGIPVSGGAEESQVGEGSCWADHGPLYGSDGPYGGCRLAESYARDAPGVWQGM